MKFWPKFCFFFLSCVAYFLYGILFYLIVDEIVDNYFYTLLIVTVGLVSIVPLLVYETLNILPFKSKKSIKGDIYSEMRKRRDDF